MMRGETKRRGRFALGLLGAAALVGACASGGSGGGTEQEESGGDRVRYFGGGESRSLDMSAEAARTLVDYLSHCIEKTEMVLRVAVNTESIETIQREASGIEVVLAEARKLQAGNTGQVLEPTHLLVPLTGRHAASEYGDNLTIFYGSPEYSRGPLLIKTGRDSLLSLLASHGIE